MVNRHYSKFIFYWDIWILVLITYAAFEIPLYVVMQYKPPVLVSVLNVLVSLVFIADVVVRYRVAHGKGKKYALVWLITDVLAAIPFELFIFTGSGLMVIAWLRVLRLVKLFRVFGFKTVWEYRINLNPGLVRLGFFFYILVLGMHWISCGWVNIHDFKEDDPTGLLWQTDLVWKYMMSAYWCTSTVTTIGYGDIHPNHIKAIEIIYTMGVQFLGAGAFGYTIGNIATLLANFDVAKMRHRERVDSVDNFMKSKKLPQGLQERVHNYFNYLWDSRQGYDDATILQELPDSFKYEFAVELNQEVLEKVPMFKGADQNLLREIAICLVPCIFTPGDAIFTFGEVGDKMYFIRKGHVEVVSADGTEVYATLGEGDFFGEVALLLKQPRNATIRSVGYCDLYSLNKESFDRVISFYTDFEKKIQQMARDRMHTARKDEGLTLL